MAFVTGLGYEGWFVNCNSDGLFDSACNLFGVIWDWGSPCEAARWAYTTQIAAWQRSDDKAAVIGSSVEWTPLHNLSMPYCVLFLLQYFRSSALFAPHQRLEVSLWKNAVILIQEMVIPISVLSYTHQDIERRNPFGQPLHVHYTVIYSKVRRLSKLPSWNRH